MTRGRFVFWLRQEVSRPIVHAMWQLGNVGCWKEQCPKQMLCDVCWELDIAPEASARARLVAPPSRSGTPERRAIGR